MKKQLGFSKILIFVLVGLVLTGVAIFAYFSMENGFPSPNDTLINQSETFMPTVTPNTEMQSNPISDDDDLETIRTELQNTDEGSLDVDLKEIDTEASSL